MAESENGINSSAAPKEKKSLLDEEIGKEFLSSWKSMSVTENDAMHFSFSTIPSGKKKPFNFGKLDMNFDLDGDFAKLPSFDVDMPDLDFTCSSKKAAKSKDKCKGESSSSKDQKEDQHFSFSFDFNELDEFNLDTTFTKEQKASMNKSVASDNNDCQGCGINLDVDGGADTLDGGQEKMVSASNSVAISGVQTGVSCEENSNLYKKLLSKSGISGEIVSHGEKYSPCKTDSAIAERKDLQILFSANEMLEVPPSEDTSQILPVQSLCGKDSTQVNTSYVQLEVSSLGCEINSEAGLEHNVDEGIHAGTGFVNKNSELDKSSLPDITIAEDNKGNSDNGADSKTTRENGIETGLLLHGLQVKASSTDNLSQTTMPDRREKMDALNSTTKVLVSLDSNHVDKLKPIKEKDPEIIQSNYFGRSVEPEPQACQPSSTIADVSSLESQRNSVMHSSHLETGNSKESSKDDQIGRKVDDNLKSFSGRKHNGHLKPFSRTLMKGEPALMGNERNIKSLCNIRDVLNENGAGSASKPPVNSRLPDKDLKKGTPSMMESIKSCYKDLKTTSSDINAANYLDKTKSNNQTSGNSTILKSSLGSKIESTEWMKAGNIIAHSSSLKISRTSRSNKDEANAKLKSEVNSLRNLEKSMEDPGNSGPKLVYLSKAETNSSVTTSMKRKKLEASNADLALLNPYKRFYPSLKERRQFNEPTENTIKDQTHNLSNKVERDNNNFHSCEPTFGQEMPQHKNIKELEISLTLQNDGSVEKAETYAKELEDICNMLKKKHEEAKELLVRAIVNNNGLLMLNHPIFAEKIRKVQQFATSLTSN